MEREHYALSLSLVVAFFGSIFLNFKIKIKVQYRKMQFEEREDKS